MQDSHTTSLAPVPASGSRLLCSFTVIGICLFTLTILTYLPAVENQFVNWDDNGYVTQNPHVAGGLTRSGLIYAWTTFDVGNWIPLTWISYQLDATLFGIDPVAFHGVNIFLHAINVVLVFAVLHQMTGSIWRSAIVAGLFGVHPLHVESVAWVSERKDLLSTCALLILLLLYERYAMRPSALRMAAVCFTFAMGLLAKSMLVTVPLLLLLIDFWPLHRWTFAKINKSTGESGRIYPIRTPWQLLIEKLPLCLLAAVECLMTVIAQWDSAVIALQSATVVSRLLNAFDAVRWYLMKTFAPWELCAFYPHPGALDLDWIEHSWPRLAFSVLIVLAISIAVVWRRSSVVVFGWFWFLISLLPVIGLIQVGSQAYADRYTYIPHLGLFVTLVWGTHRFISTTRAGRTIASVILIACLMICVRLSRAQITIWRTSETLWRHALEIDSTNLFAHLKLGIDLLDQRRLDEAQIQFSDALCIFPNFDSAIYYLGIVHEVRGDDQRAMAYFEWLLRTYPGHVGATRHLTFLYQRHPPANRPAISNAARQEIDRGMQQGSRITRQSHWGSALEHFERAIALDPTCGPARRFAGDALEELGQIDESRKHFEAAIQIDPLDLEARHGLDRLEWKKRKAK